MTKKQLIETAIEELRLAQTKPWVSTRTESFRGLRLPPSLPLPDGRQLHATDELLVAVSDYASLLISNSKEMRSIIKEEELRKIVRESFGAVLEHLDLDYSTEQLLEEARRGIEDDIRIRVQNNKQRLEMVLGCELLKSSNLYPIEIGPVTFQTKEQWCDRALSSGEVSETTARRLRSAWAGKRLKKRKRSIDSSKENSVADAVGSSATICTVMCDGLSWGMIEEKSILAARLAMCSLSLVWHTPSDTLRWMNLRYDGPLYHRYYALFGENGRYGSSASISQMPEGVWSSEDFPEALQNYSDILGVCGEVLQNYVQPKNEVHRPAVLNALFMSIWWFYEACRESSDQIATTKFAASMDAISGGNKMNGIVKLIEARLGRGPDDQFMKDGRTTKKVVADLYNAGRSRLIHGSSDDYMHDWKKSKSTAEAVARLCLVEVLAWLAKNPDIVDIDQALLE